MLTAPALTANTGDANVHAPFGHAKIALELLLLSNSSSVRGYLVDALFEITPFTRGLREAVFVPYAAVTRSYDSYASRVAEALAPAGLEVRSLHTQADPAAAIRSASLIVVGGGNTFHLLHECRRTGVLAAIGERVRAGARYLGWSAGANLACPTIRTTNDMPIVDPGGLDALGFVPFQINPHFTDAMAPGHFGETRSERLAEFVACNRSMPVLALPEGSWVRRSGDAYTLGGDAGAHWVIAGREALVVSAGPLQIPST
jgi:dipeptidase E